MNNQRQNLTSFAEIINTAGTPERLQTTPFVVDKLILICDRNNTGGIVIGDSTVAASGTKGQTIGEFLEPGQSITLEKVDLSEIYFDALNNGDAVHGSYYYRVANNA